MQHYPRQPQAVLADGLSAYWQMTATTAPGRINGVPAGDAAPAGEAASGAPALAGRAGRAWPGQRTGPDGSAPAGREPGEQRGCRQQPRAQRTP